MDTIGPLQLRVMHYIWKNGASTVHAVHSALNDEPGAQKLAYTTILTVMRNLARRKVLNQKPAGRSHIFEPIIDEETYKVGVMKQLRNDFFNGDLKRMLKMMATDEDLSKDARNRLAGAVK